MTSFERYIPEKYLGLKKAEKRKTVEQKDKVLELFPDLGKQYTGQVEILKLFHEIEPDRAESNPQEYHLFAEYEKRLPTQKQIYNLIDRRLKKDPSFESQVKSGFDQIRIVPTNMDAILATAHLRWVLFRDAPKKHGHKALQSQNPEHFGYPLTDLSKDFETVVRVDPRIEDAEDFKPKRKSYTLNYDPKNFSKTDRFQNVYDVDKKTELSAFPGWQVELVKKEKPMKYKGIVGKSVTKLKKQPAIKLLKQAQARGERAMTVRDWVIDYVTELMRTGRLRAKPVVLMGNSLRNPPRYPRDNDRMIKVDPFKRIDFDSFGVKISLGEPTSKISPDQLLTSIPL